MSKTKTKEAKTSNSKIEKQLARLLERSEADLSAADEQLKEIYKQYNIDPGLVMDPHVLAIVGAHINKTAELKIKSASEKAKLAELLHKMVLEAKQVDIAAQLAAEHMANRGDANEDLWNGQTPGNQDDDPAMTDEEQKLDDEYLQLVTDEEDGETAIVEDGAKGTN